MPRLRRSSYQKSASQCWHENVGAPRFNGSKTILIKRIKFGGKGFKGKERKIGTLKVGMEITLCLKAAEKVFAAGNLLRKLNQNENVVV
jgi:hypothetical protein